jgi:hypothetical protein
MMWAIYWSWIVSAAIIICIGLLAGRASMRVAHGKRRVPTNGWLNILIDSRGRYSLTRLQIVVWTVVIISLISGVFFGRLFHQMVDSSGGVTDAFNFTIPSTLFGLLGISYGSTVLSTAIKTAKNSNPDQAEVTAASGPGHPPRLGQVLLAEQGRLADQTIDVGKFQNFIITIVLVVGYTAEAAVSIHSAGSADGVTSLPDLSGQFLTLLGISHAGYLSLKLPPAPRKATPPGLTLAELKESDAAGTSPQTGGQPAGAGQPAASGQA